MVRSPCCEKMGLKKGPWTPEEDQVLVSYIHRHGHSNWRALPKQAGLLRCGKSCRLRWTNYLRPDIKRGNFSGEEEETIIALHGMLGNRWSAIASQLPGRTDNEIKNVWHTHLKKRLPPPTSPPATYPPAAADATKRGKKQRRAAAAVASSSISADDDEDEWTREETFIAGGGGTEFVDEPPIDESFWSLADEFTAAMEDGSSSSSSYYSWGGAGVDQDAMFWLKTFLEAGELQDLPQI